MNTQTNTLTESVSLAKAQIERQGSLVNEYVDRIKGLSKNQLTEDEQKLLKVFNGLKYNLPMINLLSVISYGGTNKEGFPNLAVATYEMSIERKSLNVRIDFDDGRLCFHDGWDTVYRTSAGFYSFPKNFFRSQSSIRGKTIVPLVPPELRQRSSDDIFILFEVNKWDLIPAPIDPYLLKHIAGDIFAIIGSWDLTQKELDAYRAIHF